MCFLGVLVLTYHTAVQLTSNVLSGRVDIPYCCTRYRWCVSWACWCRPTCWLWSRRSPLSPPWWGWRKFSCTESRPETSPHNAAHGRTDYSCTDSHPETIPHKKELMAVVQTVHTTQHMGKKLVVVAQNHHQRQVHTTQQTQELIIAVQNRRQVHTTQHTKGLIVAVQNRRQVHTTQHTKELIVAVQNRRQVHTTEHIWRNLLCNTPSTLSNSITF